MTRTDLTLTRRGLLTAAGVATFSGALGAHGSTVAVPVSAGRARFLTGAELDTLRAVVDRVVPADLSPGAVAAGCAEAIDALLAAFTVSPPRIYAGAPFSDRGGAAHNDFEEFLGLDRYERRAWRRRLEAPRTGYQAVYRTGLAALPDGFAALPGPARDIVLRGSSDPDVGALLDVVVVQTLEFMYGAPEYGGNADLVGWRITGFEGDTQPRGFTREEVEHPEVEPVSALPLPAEARGAAALGSTELLHGLLAQSGGRYRDLRRLVDGLVAPSGEAAAGLASIAVGAAELVRQAEEDGR